ncbi:ATP-binding cassette domain-containing protein [Streptomyces armeniacus]|uniref:ATP-binding cassette domain-containing protein n=1 Tax=Streptomyces armeniacus TaxID=83291 RepID=A0A345XMK6_9ACTN|nr:ATP-binding cassette domain-containing protein [Streptomyces armeniacus]AXK32872.1 ATP-binding cassette domain-containing protein [Streptomyces armeniacus]
MRLRGVGRRYRLGGPWVLRGVDADLPEAAVLRVEGTNGSGKSTLLRLLAGIDAPSSGRITGRPRRTAYVPERFPAALPFSAAGYLTHQARARGLRGGAAARAAGEWLERFGAGAYARTPMADLSKGSSQKVAVAQALLAEPRLLVLDEAWTGLDREARDELDRAVAERVADAGTVVYVDHDPRRLADSVHTVLRVADGRVAAAAGAAAADSGAGDSGAAAGAASGPTARVTVTGPPGAALPVGLPGAPRGEPGLDGSVRLTVPAAHSDALLRALLAARPPWHIRTVEPPTAPEADSAEGGHRP